MKHIVFIITITFLISCQAKKENSLDTHRIVFLTPYFEKYVELKRTNKTLGDTYGQMIYDYLADRYFSGSEYAAAFKFDRTDTVKYEEEISLDELNSNIESINKNRSVLTKKINSALIKSHSYLPNDGVTVFIMPSFTPKQELEKRVRGIGGLTVGSKHILLDLNLDIKGWEELLEYTIAHEFNHTYWIKHNLSSCEETMLERLEVEGKAEAFAHRLYPNAKTPWDSTMNETQRQELWNKIKPELKNKSYSFQNSIMFGDSIYPFDGGYILGRYMVEAALKKNPNIEPKYWTNFSADYILKESGYK